MHRRAQQFVSPQLQRRAGGRRLAVAVRAEGAPGPAALVVSPSLLLLVWLPDHGSPAPYALVNQLPPWGTPPAHRPQGASCGPSALSGQQR